MRTLLCSWDLAFGGLGAYAQVTEPLPFAVTDSRMDQPESLDSAQVARMMRVLECLPKREWAYGDWPDLYRDYGIGVQPAAYMNAKASRDADALVRALEEALRLARELAAEEAWRNATHQRP